MTSNKADGQLLDKICDALLVAGVIIVVSELLPKMRVWMQTLPRPRMAVKPIPSHEAIRDIYDSVRGSSQ